MLRKVFIRHRVNQLEDLKTLDPHWGAELDLRSDVTRPGSLHLSHDPWRLGVDFEEWLHAFQQRKIQGPLLLNTKEDGLEEAIETLLRKFAITNYLFLDTTFPTLVKNVLAGRGDKFFIRLSSFEPSQMIEKFQGRVQWIWADCFQADPPDLGAVTALSRHFKICLVSPELHGVSISEISRFSSLYPYAQAICTKDPAAWMERFERNF